LYHKHRLYNKYTKPAVVPTSYDVKDGEQYFSTSISSMKSICENVQVGE
jgi:hypothetical protein